MSNGMVTLRELIHAGKTMDGTVKWFQDGRGYGYIVGDDEREYFVHWRNIYAENEAAFRSLTMGDRVRFVPIERPKGPAAYDVRRILHEVM